MTTEEQWHWSKFYWDTIDIDVINRGIYGWYVTITATLGQVEEQFGGDKLEHAIQRLFNATLKSAFEPREHYVD